MKQRAGRPHNRLLNVLEGAKRSSVAEQDVSYDELKALPLWSLLEVLHPQNRNLRQLLETVGTSVHAIEREACGLRTAPSLFMRLLQTGTWRSEDRSTMQC